MDNAFRRQAMRIAQHEGAWCTAGVLKTVTFSISRRRYRPTWRC